MKIGFVSDVHSNLAAFQAVLLHMDTQGVDIKVSLGDTVGYGPSPNECVDLTVSNFNYIVMGNHDEASVNLEKAWGFNALAKEAIEWTNEQLSLNSKEYLKSLEHGYMTDEGLLFVHGTPGSHYDNDYIHTDRQAQIAFTTATTDFNIAFIGHTHVPAIWLDEEKIKSLAVRYHNIDAGIGKCEYIIPSNTRAIINTGSVGQPRDNDSRSSYATYDTQARLVTFFKIPYSLETTIGKMQQKRLPLKLWQRLLYGK